jgi:hypothetical protein
MKETDLFPPLSQYLKEQGYEVYSEVKNCDITARKGEELLVIELKTRFSLALVYQAVDRKRLTPSVYVAIPVMGSGKIPPNYRSMKALLRRLETGLILIRILKKSTRVEIVLHPKPFEERMAPRRRDSIIREINGRYGEFNQAGSTSKDEKISAYKQEAIRIGWWIKKDGPLSPKELRSKGCGDKTQRILADNHYGWFNRIRKGVYELDEAGEKALEEYPAVTALLKEITN